MPQHIRFFLSIIILTSWLSACTSTTMVSPRISDNQAVLALLHASYDHSVAGDYANAEVKLERALRIEPGNADLWYELAHIKFQQEQYSQAESLALRANSFAGNKDFLRRDIWNLIGQARGAQNNFNGAQEAYKKARTY